MERKELLLIWFNYEGYSFSKVDKILEKINDINELFDENIIKNAFFEEKYADFRNKILSTDFDKFEKDVLESLYKNNVSVITYVSEKYPETLLDIDEPPLVLYVRGNIDLLKEKSISIVGTRKPTTYGRIVCEDFTKKLSEAGLVTVSGLAYGIDTIVAESTLAVGGKTIAVLAGGLDSIYPKQNTSLANKIVENGGLLVSEYRIGLSPLSHQFICRNRIVSALSLGLLIIEAGKTSGTMTTARFAIEQSKELFIVPGNITSAQSEGTNGLIDEMPDTFTISPNRILFKLNIKKKTTQKVQKQVDMLESQILAELENGEVSFDDLCDRLNISASAISPKLIKLEMFGFIKKGNGNVYYKTLM